MTDVLTHVLAKSARGTRPPETLGEHTATVLGRLAAWRRRYPELPRHTNRGDLWDLAAWACLLHDIGKTARGFQAMLGGGPRFVHRHEALSLLAVGWLDSSDETVGLVAAGVGTHHRDLGVLRQSYPFDTDERDLLLADLPEEDETRWRLWLEGEGAPDLSSFGFARLPVLRLLPRRAALDRAFRSLLLLGEVIRTRPADDPAVLAARSVRGLVLLADHAGSAHELLPDAQPLTSVARFTENARGRLTRGMEPHQQACAEVIGHTILTAPTGSGKTEAALLWAARQREDGPGRPTMFYVLPYRASLNAMRARIPSYGIRDEEVVLQHSSATAALYQYALDRKGYTSAEAERAARHERDLGRLMTAPIRVLTPYQLLRAFFGLPGHEAILSDAAGGVYVLDELHAYDMDRLAIILASVRHLAHDLGGRFLVMSATFPRVLKLLLQEILDDAVGEISATPATLARFRRHILRILDRDLLADDTLRDAVSRFDAGEAVLVVANTVARARALFDGLRQRIGDDGVTLLHSRFTARDRAEKELSVSRKVGTGQRRPGAGGTLLVATQVVEVSLDIDFDVLFTDAAPLESLLQRFGRVNRGLRGGLRDVIVHAAIATDGSPVYSAARVGAALATLRPNSDRPVEEADVAAWVDSVYAQDAGDWLSTMRRRVKEIFDTVVRANRPLDSHPELRDLFDRLFDGYEVVPATLEAEYRTLECEAPIQAAFLRVPISHGQRELLIRRGRLDRVGEIVRVPYDSIRGLDLTFSDNDV